MNKIKAKARSKKGQTEDQDKNGKKNGRNNHRCVTEVRPERMVLDPRDSSSLSGMMSKVVLFLLSVMTAALATMTLTHLGKVEDEIAEHTVMSSQQGSLKQPYSLDHRQILQSRSTASYSYPYRRYGIDRRSNLSLQEFNDIYNGKWYALLLNIYSVC